MMRTETTTRTLYQFDELSEQAKQAAMEKLYDINVDHGWWDCTYDDAEGVGCKITGFDIGRPQMCDLTCDDAVETSGKIMENHGESCDTYKLAESFLQERDEIVNAAERDEDGELADEYALDKKLDEVEAEFVRALSEEYLSLLRNDYEYLTGEEAILESIEANEYEFTEDGKLA